MIQSALMTYLRTQISAVSNRVFCIKAPENPIAPYIVIDLENSFHERYLDYSNGLKEYDFEIACYGTTPEQAIPVAKTIITTLESYRGRLTSTESPQVNYYIADIAIVSQSENYDYQADLVVHSVFITVQFR